MLLSQRSGGALGIALGQQGESFLEHPFLLPHRVPSAVLCVPWSERAIVCCLSVVFYVGFPTKGKWKITGMKLKVVSTRSLVTIWTEQDMSCFAMLSPPALSI